MGFYCDGLKNVEIKDELDRKGLELHRTTISTVIRKYLILFGLYNHGK